MQLELQLAKLLGRRSIVAMTDPGVAPSVALEALVKWDGHIDDAERGLLLGPFTHEQVQEAKRLGLMTKLRALPSRPEVRQEHPVGKCLEALKAHDGDTAKARAQLKQARPEQQGRGDRPLQTVLGLQPVRGVPKTRGDRQGRPERKTRGHHWAPTALP